jgi:hypothetical protein
MTWTVARQGRPIGGDEASADPYVGLQPEADVCTSIVSRDPQAFLVRLGQGWAPDNGRLRTHYHEVDQFQWVVQGGGRFHGDSLVPGVLHYADAYQPYGPIDPAPEGLAFLTLRGATAFGAHYMPEERAHLASSLKDGPRPASARRSLTFDLAGAVTAGDGWTDLMWADDDLRVAVTDLGEGAAVAPVTVGGDGAYVLVVTGAVRDSVAGELPEGSTAWVPPGAVVSGLVGAAPVARVALAQLPQRPDLPERAATG